MMSYSAQLAILELYIPSSHSASKTKTKRSQIKLQHARSFNKDQAVISSVIDDLIWGPSSPEMDVEMVLDKEQLARDQRAGERRFESLEVKVERLKARLGRRESGDEAEGAGEGEEEGRSLVEMVVEARRSGETRRSCEAPSPTCMVGVAS